MKHSSLFSLMIMIYFLAIGCDTAEDMEEDITPTMDTANLDPDAAPVLEGDWYRPAADVTWQWQIQGTINTDYDVDLYDVDLFDTPTDIITQIQTNDRKVICYFSAGSGENWRPDYDRFDASVLGRTLDGWEGERWLDIRSRNVVDVMEARLDLAVSKGCDGVEPDNVTAFNNDTGYAVSARHQLAFNRHLANEAHRRGLAIALKNDGDQAADLVDYFDFELNEECHQYEECDQLSVFTQQGKPVLNAEYAANRDQAEARKSTICSRAAAMNTRTLILPLDLDDAFRVACNF